MSRGTRAVAARPGTSSRPRISTELQSAESEALEEKRLHLRPSGAASHASSRFSLRGGFPAGPLAAAAILLVACGVSPGTSPDASSSRLERLHRGFTQRASDPLAAASAFADAGSGVLLENARLTAWFGALRRAEAPSDAWRRLLDEPPPADMRAAVRSGLGGALLAEGRTAEAVAVLEAAAAAGSGEAAERLLTVADPSLRRRIASRLAVTDPERLRRADRGLERETLAVMTPAGWLERSQMWREAGHAAIARAELRRLRWRGEAERARRLELARAEIDSGQSEAGLALVPALTRSSRDELLVRAEADRRIGWSRVPRAAAAPAFRSCLVAAERARSVGSGVAANALALECATEADRLDDALAAWRRLEVAHWDEPRRSWLGRRLGVALGRAGRRGEALEVAAALPDQARCVRLWAAGHGAERDDVLRRLSEAPVSDLYAVWAQEELGAPAPATPRTLPAVGPATPPTSVRLLLEWGAPAEALAEWRRLAAVRGLLPGEALAAAELATASGRPNDAIGWLRLAAPELGTIDMTSAPRDLVRAYLPLRWPSALIDAARRAGVPPWLVAGVARQESVFSEVARSPAGAVGVLQLVPGTARLHARALGMSGPPDLTDPELNLRLGARELAGLLQRFGAIEPALAAYNAGEARARRWWSAWPDRRRFTEEIPIPETYGYVRRVVFLAEAYRELWAEAWPADS